MKNWFKQTRQKKGLLSAVTGLCELDKRSHVLAPGDPIVQSCSSRKGCKACMSNFSITTSVSLARLDVLYNANRERSIGIHAGSSCDYFSWVVPTEQRRFHLSSTDASPPAPERADPHLRRMGMRRLVNTRCTRSFAHSVILNAGNSLCAHHWF